MKDTMNDRLKNLRSRLGLSQKEMAEKLSVKQSYFSDIENGRRTLTEKFIGKIESEYHVLRDWIYTGKGYMFLNDTPASQNADFAGYGAILKTESSLKEIENRQIKKLKEVKTYKNKLLNELDNKGKEYLDMISAFKAFSNSVTCLMGIEENYLKIHNPSDYYESIIFSDNIENSILSYEEYKHSVLTTINKIHPFLQTIKSFVSNVDDFLSEIKPIDTEGIIWIPKK